MTAASSVSSPPPPIRTSKCRQGARLEKHRQGQRPYCRVFHCHRGGPTYRRLSLRRRRWPSPRPAGAWARRARAMCHARRSPKTPYSSTLASLTSGAPINGAASTQYAWHVPPGPPRKLSSPSPPRLRMRVSPSKHRVDHCGRIEIGKTTRPRSTRWLPPCETFMKTRFRMAYTGLEWHATAPRRARIAVVSTTGTLAAAAGGLDEVAAEAMDPALGATTEVEVTASVAPTTAGMATSAENVASATRTIDAEGVALLAPVATGADHRPQPRRVTGTTRTAPERAVRTASHAPVNSGKQSRLCANFRRFSCYRFAPGISTQSKTAILLPDRSLNIRTLR